LPLGSARADKGVIAANNSKCFVIGTPSGFVLVDGWVNAPQGTAVIGNFNTYGSTKIFDTNGNDVSGYIYIEEWGLSKSRLLENGRTNVLFNAAQRRDEHHYPQTAKCLLLIQSGRIPVILVPIGKSE
jgi:hypothetical protein